MATLTTDPPFAAGAAAATLIDAVQKLSQVGRLEEIIDVVKRAARQITGADGATFVLRDGDFCHYVDEDAIGPLWKGRRFPIDVCISGWAMRHRQPTLIPDIVADARIPQEAYRPTFVKSLAMVPIRSLLPLGAIGIYWRETHRPTPVAVQWLQSLADSTALALEHVQSLDEFAEVRYRSELLQQENDELRRDLRVADEGCVKMCFITKRLEVDGRWISIETFLKQRCGLDVTHGLSPEAFERLGSAPAEPVTAR